MTDHLSVPGSRLTQQHTALRAELDAALTRVMDRAVLTPDAEVRAFETEFARYVGVRHVIGAASGSAALLLALRALDVGSGDEVISIPTIDISASAPIAHAGARVVWADINPRTFTLDPEALERQITARTRAILVVHMYGNPTDMAPILEIANRRGIPVIEDASLAHGATYKGQQVGSLGHIGCFSFAPGKILSALGKAGAVSTNDTDLAHKIRVLSSYGFRPSSLDAIEHGVVGAPFEYLVEGFNARMDELQAAVLRVKLPHLDGWIERRRANAALYRQRLAPLEPERLLLPQDTADSTPVFRSFVIRSHRRDQLMHFLAQAGIWTARTYIPLLHLQPVYRHLGYGLGSFPNAELVGRELLALPTFPELSKQEVEWVGDMVCRFFDSAGAASEYPDNKEILMSRDRPVARIAISISSRPGRPANENPIYRGLQVAIEELERADTLPVRLEWRVFDDSGNPEKTSELAHEIRADPAIIAVIGPMGSDEAFANAPIFNEAGIVQISPCASHPDLCRRGFKTFFRLVANENAQGRELARMAYGYLNARRVGIVHPDDVWGTTVSDIFAREFEKLGGRIVERQAYPKLADEFSDLIQATADSDPDLVFCIVHPVEGPKISAGLREAGLTVPFLGTDAMKTSFPLGGGEANAEAYHTYSGADFRRLPQAAAFRQAYNARFPEDSTYSPEAYDAAMIVAEALRRAGIADRARVLEEVRKLRDFEGVSGLINFDETGERLDAPISFYRVRKTGDGREMYYLGTTSELLPSREAEAGR